MQPLDLCELAIVGRTRAYAPYSRFTVGAALLTIDGQVFQGCNVENGVLALSICAEQVALAKAVSEGSRKFQAIAVAATPLAPPCGSCRQFLSEFDDDLQIILCDAKRPEDFQIWTLRQLLPVQFKFSP